MSYKVWNELIEAMNGGNSELSASIAATTDALSYMRSYARHHPDDFPTALTNDQLIKMTEITVNLYIATLSAKGTKND